MVEWTEVEQLFLDKNISKTNSFTSNPVIQRATKKNWAIKHFNQSDFHD